MLLLKRNSRLPHIQQTHKVLLLHPPNIASPRVMLQYTPCQTLEVRALESTSKRLRDEIAQRTGEAGDDGGVCAGQVVQFDSIKEAPLLFAFVCGGD